MVTQECFPISVIHTEFLDKFYCRLSFIAFKEMMQSSNMNSAYGSLAVE